MSERPTISGQRAAGLSMLMVARDAERLQWHYNVKAPVLRRGALRHARELYASASRIVHGLPVVERRL